MSDTPFTSEPEVPFTPGPWWLVSYMATGTTSARIRTKAFRFYHEPDVFTDARVADCLNKIREESEGKRILILSWSKFIVPEET